MSQDDRHLRSTDEPIANAYFGHDLPTSANPDLGLILVTGASGYVGGRLIPVLLERGYQVRLLVRGDKDMYATQWPGLDVVEGDARKMGDLTAALDGVAVAYYLIHSMVLGREHFAAADLEAARNFRQAAQQAGLSRIIYLGGLSPDKEALAKHLASRQRVARELAAGSVATTILRASVIIGSGSASFETIRSLVNNLVVIPLPPWSRNLTQPIGIRDVVKYLVAVLETPEAANRTYDIGGADILSYAGMMQALAKILKKRRYFFKVPFGHTSFAGFIMSLVTPVPAPITLCLTGSLKHETVCRDASAVDTFRFTPLTYQEAVIRAMDRDKLDQVSTRWSNAYPPAHELAIKLHQLRRAPRFSAHHTLRSNQTAEALFEAISRIGGRQGWFNANWMWRLRGAFDRLIFGVGSARGRRSSRDLAVNDVIDFWRVEDLKPNRRLLLRAEMRMPGRAWLEFSLTPDGDGNVLALDAYYATRSLYGTIYWRMFQPFHWYIFDTLLKQIERRAIRQTGVPG